MGLDNGITLYTKHEIDFNKEPSYLVKFVNMFRAGVYEYDICYWRKCWDVRERIINILNAGQEGGAYEIDTPEQVIAIREALIDFLRQPEEWRDSIWEIGEILDTLGQQIINLTWLADYMTKHRNEYLVVEFYDSYQEAKESED